MRAWIVMASMGCLLVGSLAGEAGAQTRGRADRDRAEPLVPGGTRAPAQAAGRGGGPAFCRSGAGHPVFGRAWCIQKGFGLGTQGVRWGEPAWNDVIFRTTRRPAGLLRQPDLIDVLGDVVFARLSKHAATIGASQPLSGTWISEGRPTVLRILAGGVPVAELHDTRGIGRVDRILLNMGR
jgi:hypothetical protein